MNEARLIHLVDKFNQASASKREELELKELVQDYNGNNQEILWMKEYFSSIAGISNPISEVEIDKMVDFAIVSKRRNPFMLFSKTMYWAAAAMIVIFFSLYIGFADGFNNKNEIARVDTFDDPYLAYMETKKALLMISNKMNEHAEPLSNLNKLENGLNPMDDFSKLGKYSDKVFNEPKNK